MDPVGQKGNGVQAQYTVPDATSYPITLSAMTSGWTPDGKDYLKLAEPFCQCMRTIVDRRIRGIPYSKAELSEAFGLSSRLYNSADIFARGEHASLEETKYLALAKTKTKYKRVLNQYVKLYLYEHTAPEGSVTAQERNLIARIGKWRRKVQEQEANIAQPRYFPGQDIYDRQHELGPTEFKKQFKAARNNRIIAVGEWSDPPCCNSELQIHYLSQLRQGEQTVGYQFSVVHAGNTLCVFKLSRIEGEQLLVRLLENQIPYEYAPSFRLPTAKELKNRTFGYGEDFIGPIAIAYEKKIREDYYIPLTVMLIRDKKKLQRWQIRITWMQPCRPAYAVGNTFLGFDINNDSVAYLIYRLEAGKLTILYTAEPKFLSQTGNAEERLRQLHLLLNEMFDKAFEYQACIIGEDLHWEGAKMSFSALSAMLHAIPYSAIRQAVVRKSLIRGVPLRFISPEYSSILGGLFTQLNRDKAASLIIGLKGSDQGLDFLESFCRQQLESSARIPYKVEVKNRFSEVVKVEVARQLLPQSVDGDSASLIFTHKLSRILGEVRRHRTQLFYRNGKAGKRLGSVVTVKASCPPRGPDGFSKSRRKSGRKKSSALFCQCSTLSKTG